MATTFVLAMALAATPQVDVELAYAGTLVQSRVSRDKPDAKPSSKSFALLVLVAPADNGPAIHFALDERGSGWAWPESFGAIFPGQPESKGIRVLHTFEGTPYVVPLPALFFLPKVELSEGVEWKEGLSLYRCGQIVESDGIPCWRIEAQHDRGRRQALVVEQQTGLIRQLEERLFLGRGDEFELKLMLESSRRLEPAERERHRKVALEFLALQQRLERNVEREHADLTAEQLDIVASTLPALRMQSENTMWSRLAETVDRDASQQARKLAGISGLAKKFVGETIPLTDLKLISGDTLKAEDVRGQTLILHFWKYDGDKLIEPYGQVGYLDFLHQRRGKLGAKVIGVAVDEDFALAGRSATAQRTVKKLRDFMNLGFPIALDAGPLIQKFGDPRTLQAELPLWVVIGHDGVITHYHVGYYDIRPDEGLRELDAAVVGALKRQKAGESRQ